MTDFDNFRGPGPIIHGPDRNQPGLHIIQLADGTIGTATHTDIQTIPIHGQWFTGTKNGLICSWPDKATAQQRADQTGALIGQIAPVTITELRAFLDQNDPDYPHLVNIIQAARDVLDAFTPDAVLPEGAEMQALRHAFAAYDRTPDSPEPKLVILVDPNGQPLPGA